MAGRERWDAYLATLKSGNFTKASMLEFLQPDGSVAFAIDNEARHGGAVLQEGNLTVSLQNGQRRRADITLSNTGGQYEYNVNKLWFGRQIRLQEGLILPDGTPFYLPQGVFYISEPEEALHPGSNKVTCSLLDKWAYLDGTLQGELDGIYEVPMGRHIFEAVDAVLQRDRGNGEVMDRVKPIYTEYYNGKTVILPNGEEVSVLTMPYTYRCDGENGVCADIILEMNTILAGWVGYDATGRLRMDTSDDDLLDIDKPTLWDFSHDQIGYLGATYAVKDTEVYNDIIIEGETLDSGRTARGRAINMDVRSDTSIYSSLGRRVKRLKGSGYYADEQCQQLAAYWLKRYTTLKKSVTISAQQIFHLNENNLVTIRRGDKPGEPIEKHLVTGFSRPIAQSGPMTINATSVNDFAQATIVDSK